MMQTGLILGCGNIAAGYDDPEKGIITHASAYRELKIKFDVFDTDKSKAAAVSERYGVRSFDSFEQIDLRAYEIVSICTPTDTHHDYLQLLLSDNVPLIVCEKPLSNKITELDNLKSLYEQSASKVIVNYIRRFQPKFNELKESISDILTSQSLHSISIRYCRGFLNNCSHAIDLLEYLFDKSFDTSTLTINNAVFDVFKNDPTLSASGTWMGAGITISGNISPEFIFEIDINFSDSKLTLRNSGDLVLIDSAGETKRFEGCLHNYMLPVIQHTLGLNNKNDDNFRGSLELNKRLIEFLAKHEQTGN